MSFMDQILTCIKLGKTADFELFLQNSDVLCSKDNSRSTLLHHAVECGNKYFAQQLIDLGLNVDAQNCIGETPLMFAVRNNNEELVMLLLKANADIFIADVNAQCVVGKAFCMPGIKECIKKMILGKITPESLCKSKHVKSKDFHNDCPLYHFISLENIELTRILLEIGSPVDARDPKTQRTALHLAVGKLDLQHIRLLIKHHADVNARDYNGRRPLSFIHDYGNKDTALEIVKTLLNAGAMLIDYEQSEIVVTSILSKGDIQLIRFILQCNIDLQFKNKCSRTPIDYLFDNVNPDVYTELDHFKIDLNTCSERKVTMLHRATAKANDSLVQYLLERGVDVNAKDCFGRTSLCFAVDPILNMIPTSRNMNNRMHCIELLLKYGADPYILTKENYNHVLIFEESVINLTVELMKPILNHVALHEASGQEIDQFMISELEKRHEFQKIIISNRHQLAEMKQIKIDESVSLFDLLIVKSISFYAENSKLISNLYCIMKEYCSDSYYSCRLQERFLKLTRLVAINDIFIKFYNVSLINVSEKIVDYL